MEIKSEQGEIDMRRKKKHGSTVRNAEGMDKIGIFCRFYQVYPMRRVYWGNLY